LKTWVCHVCAKLDQIVWFVRKPANSNAFGLDIAREPEQSPIPY
jgi:hypothetical protein